jgi:phage tail-like protein
MGDQKNPGKRVEAFGAYYFRVDLHAPDGSVMGSFPFRSCSGLKSESAVVELEEGGFNVTTRKLIGRTKYPNIVLKQGLCGPTSELWKLRLRFLNDGPEQPMSSKHKGRNTPHRISGTITQLGPNGATAKWAFTGGWVCKWEGPDFDATKNEVSIESIEIAHEGLMMLSGTEAK